MPRVWIPSSLRELTGGQEEVRVTGRTVGQVLTGLQGAFPQIGDRLFAADGTLHDFLTVMVDGVEAESLWVEVAAESEVVIVPAIGGGRAH